MASETARVAETSARTKAATAVRADPATAQAWALVSIADSLAAISRDLHKIANRRV